MSPSSSDDESLGRDSHVVAATAAAAPVTRKRKRGGGATAATPPPPGEEDEGPSLTTTSPDRASPPNEANAAPAAAANSDSRSSSPPRMPLPPLREDASSSRSSRLPSRRPPLHPHWQSQSQSLWSGVGGAFRRPRPLPASHVLANLHRPSAAAAAPYKVPPILADFLARVGKKDPPQAVPAGTDDGGGGADSAAPTAGGIPGDAAEAASRLSELGGADAVFDPRHSTLTDAQHKRFLELAPQIDVKPLHLWKEASRREYQNLLRKVLREQDAYKRALERFWISHTDRLLASSSSSRLMTPGLVAGQEGDPEGGTTDSRAGTSFLASAPPGAWERLVSDGVLPQRYNGKCNQVISLGIVQDPFVALLLDSLTSQVLLETTDGAGGSCGPSPRVDALPPVGNVLTPPLAALRPPIELLVADSVGRNLAETHKVDVFTAEETLRAALAACQFFNCRQSDGFPQPAEKVVGQCSSSSRLLVPVSRPAAGSVVELDLPVPQPWASPRECLEASVEEALYQSLRQPPLASSPRSSSNDRSDDQTPSPPVLAYRYTLLQIPAKGRWPLRVLVRSPIRLRGSGSHHGKAYENHNSEFLKVHARAEYFPERGQGLPSSLDKATWVLDHLLGGGGGGSDFRVAVCRVDAVTWRCLGWDDATWAAATSNPARWYERIALGDDNGEEGEGGGGGGCATDLWRRMASLLQAARTVGVGRHVLSYPGRGGVGAPSLPRSATVHGADPRGSIDLLEELREAAAVGAGPEAILQSLRPWHWTRPNHVPYTFPTESTRAPEVVRETLAG